MEPKQRTFSAWYAVAAMLVLFGIQAILLAPHPENLSYSEFKVLVKAGKVSDLVLYKDTIAGTLPPTGLEGVLPKEKIEEIKRAGKGAHAFVTTRVEDPGPSCPHTKGHARSGSRSLRHRSPDAGIRRGRPGQSGQRGGAPRGA